MSTRAPYSPKLAWLRALAYFAFCFGIAAASGALQSVLGAPLVPADAGAAWWALALGYLAIIVIGYAVIWPIGTFTDNRARHGALSIAYGATWGLAQGMWFLTIWTWIGKAGLAPLWSGALAYLAIGGYNGLWHRFFWDIYVSPPHNYTEWNGRKVLLAHTPNLIVGLVLLGLYGSGGVYVLMQALALGISAFVMRFPAPWDQYTAVAGQERTLS